jgi:hypothetical protein
LELSSADIDETLYESSILWNNRRWYKSGGLPNIATLIGRKVASDMKRAKMQQRF